MNVVNRYSVFYHLLMIRNPFCFEKREICSNFDIFDVVSQMPEKVVILVHFHRLYSKLLYAKCIRIISGCIIPIGKL